jgi:hypothetical protein
MTEILILSIGKTSRCQSGLAGSGLGQGVLVAASYCSITLAEILPRSLTAMP